MSGAVKFRYANEAVGAAVLLTVVLFVAAVFQTGRLRAWFEPDVQLRVILPEEGLFGLSKGARVQILGTAAGSVEQIVVEPGRRIHAKAVIKEKMADFIRSDSRAVIRKEFGVAGAAYLEITRGEEEPLDWEYAVIEADAELAPTESMGELLADARTRVLPAVDEARLLLVNLNGVVEKIASGQGAIGRLLMEERTVVELETLLTRLNEGIDMLSPLLEDMQKTVKNVAALSSDVAKQSGQLPGITRDAGEALQSLQSILKDLDRVTPQIPALVENVNTVASDVPVLLIQTQQALTELTLLLRQLRSHWLLGGGDDGDALKVERISPLEVAP